jgi:hypothetical protein
VEIVLALVIVALVAWFVTAPLRRTDGAGRGRFDEPAIADLEARKEAKYREIRDAELDREQGKLSEEDWRRQDAELRREAVDVLDRLESARGGRSREEPERRPASGS